MSHIVEVTQYVLYKKKGKGEQVFYGESAVFKGKSEESSEFSDDGHGILHGKGTTALCDPPAKGVNLWQLKENLEKVGDSLHAIALMWLGTTTYTSTDPELTGKTKCWVEWKLLITIFPPKEGLKFEALAELTVKCKGCK